MNCKQLTEHIGTAVTGVDLSSPLSLKTVQTIKAELAERGVVVFRAAEPISADALVAFAAHLGEVRPHPLLAAAVAAGPASEQDVAKVGTSIRSTSIVLLVWNRMFFACPGVPICIRYHMRSIMHAVCSHYMMHSLFLN